MKVRGDKQAGDKNVGWVSAQMVFTATSVDAEKSEGIKETRKAAASEREGKLRDHASERRQLPTANWRSFPTSFFQIMLDVSFLDACARQPGTKEMRSSTF